MADTANLPWDDFRLVKSIADARSLNGAAEALGLNHSTVFRRLEALEGRIGARLFERHRGGYAATPAGEEMAALARRMDDDVTAFSRRLAGQAIKPSGELRVTTNDTLLLCLLTPVFAAFRRQCPDIRLDVVLGNQALNLSRRDADVAIRATADPPETLVGRRIASIGWAVYGRKLDGFASAPEGGVERALAAEASWVGLGDGLSQLPAARFLRERVPSARIAYKVNTVLGLAEAIEAGIGVGPLPCFIGDAKPDLERIGTFEPADPGGLWLLTHPDLKSSPRVRVFLDFVAAEMSRHKRAIEGNGPAPGAA